VRRHLRQRRHRADLQAAVGLLDADQVLDLTEVDHGPRPAEAILQPVHAVEPARQHPVVVAVLVHQAHRIVHRRRLEQLECRNDVSNHCHSIVSVMRIEDCGLRIDW
jgi:hypothetical protein